MHGDTGAHQAMEAVRNIRDRQADQHRKQAQGVLESAHFSG